jgi:hypothetical protein
MLRSAIFLFICLFWTLHSCAQDTTSSGNFLSQGHTTFHRWAITFKPLGALSPFMTNYTFGLQYKVTRKIVVEADAGWIQTWFYISTSNAENISSSGYRVTGEMKYVLWKGMYFSLQGFYNDYTRSSEEYVWRFGETYEEKMDVKRVIYSWGGHMKYGWMLTKPNKKFFFDFYGGLGLRQKNISIPDLPVDAEVMDNGEFDQTPGQYTYPSLTLGMSIGYSFR